MKKITASSVAKAREMIAYGKGDNKDYFVEFNTGKQKKMYTTANIYSSYYDPDIFPNINHLLSQIQIPTLWVAGTKDRLTTVHDMESLFEMIEETNSNKYVLIKGGHKKVLKNSAPIIINWLKSL